VFVISALSPRHLVKTDVGKHERGPRLPSCSVSEMASTCSRRATRSNYGDRASDEAFSLGVPGGTVFPGVQCCSGVRSDDRGSPFLRLFISCQAM
jgi:hypothetical protein